MRGRHSIWRRWGRYQEQGIREMPFFICIKPHFLCIFYAALESKNIDNSTMYKIMHKRVTTDKSQTIDNTRFGSLAYSL